jgi:hypothetical protein
MDFTGLTDEPSELKLCRPGRSAIFVEQNFVTPAYQRVTSLMDETEYKQVADTTSRPLVPFEMHRRLLRPIIVRAVCNATLLRLGAAANGSTGFTRLQGLQGQGLVAPATWSPGRMGCRAFSYRADRYPKRRVLRGTLLYAIFSVAGLFHIKLDDLQSRITH